MTETWKQIKGYNGQYLVSDQGNVFSLKSKRQLKPHDVGCRRHYLVVKFWDKKKKRNVLKYIHRLVCAAFHGPAKGRHCNHLDNDPQNNIADNLSWVTPSQNVRHYWRLRRKGLA